MDIGFDTVGYVLLILVAIPAILFNHRLIIYFLIIITIDDTFFPERIPFGPLNIYLQDLILFLYCCFSGWIIFKRLINKEKVIELPEKSALLMFLILMYLTLHISYMVMALHNGVQIDSTIRRFSTYSGCLYFLSPFLLFDNKNQFRNLLSFIVILAILTPVLQLKTFVGSEQWQWAVTSSGTVRLGIGGTSIIACALFAILVFKNDIKYYFLSVCPVISIILIGHRSVLLAIGASLMFYFMLTRKVTKALFFVYFLGFSLLIAFIGLEMFTGHSFLDDAILRGKDTFNVENPTSQGRLKKIEHNFQIFKKRPIFGIGYNYEEIINIVAGPIIFNSEDEGIIGPERDVLHPHNFLLRLMSHTGIVGTMIFIAILILIFNRCRVLIRSKSSNSSIGILIFCTIVFFLIFALMNTTFITEGWFFWALCGAILVFNPKDEYKKYA